MTESELNEVRELRRELVNGEQKLRMLREQAARLTARLDGLPHAQATTSPLELLTVKIVDLERELDEMRAMMNLTAESLIYRLSLVPLTPREFSIVALRYVSCMNFRDIQFELRLSDATVFFHHRNALKKIFEPTVALQ